MEPQLVQEYVATGKVHFQYQDYLVISTSPGSESFNAAEAAMCAGDQGKFWQYHDTLYENLQGENVGSFTVSRLKQMAQQMGLNTDQFNSCLDNHQHQADVQANRQEGAGQGINSTPTLTLNGQRVNWNGSWESLKAVLDQALQQ